MTYAVIEQLPDGRERILGVGFTDVRGYPDDTQLWGPKLWAVSMTPERLLADGKWREVAPAEPRDVGQVGGDGQLSTAWGRRFARRRDDGLWAVIDDFFFVETDANREVGFSWITHGRHYSVSRDLRDVGGTEEWADVTYEALDSVGTPTDRDAYAMCEMVDGDFGWDGQPFSSREG